MNLNTRVVQFSKKMLITVQSLVSPDTLCWAGLSLLQKMIEENA